MKIKHISLLFFFSFTILIVIISFMTFAHMNMNMMMHTNSDVMMHGNSDMMNNTTDINSDNALNSATPRTGEQIYNSICASCHATGVANAPKLSDKKEWMKRITQGKLTLLTHVENGIPNTAMPAKGSCFNCSNKELSNTIDYMLQKVQKD